MKKKVILSCACVLALACAGFQTFAQNNPNQPAPQANPSAPSATTPAEPQKGDAIDDPQLAAKIQARLQTVSTELNLTDEQKAQIKPILRDKLRRINAVKNDPQLSKDEKRSKIDGIRDDFRGQARQFLTPDQNKKLDVLKEDQEDYPQ
ncbi:MAG TPA: hypothetical protein VJA94_09655 [Candidatus Angelobacter sp.]